MDGIDSLADVEQIKKLKAAYFRCMDLKLWDELEGLFTPDAMFDVRGALQMPKPEEEYEEPIIQGAAAIREFISAGLTTLTSVHCGYMPEIEILTECTARGTWPMQDLLIAPPGSPFSRFQGWGHYWETYSKQEGRWQIATLRLRRLYVEVS